MQLEAVGIREPLMLRLSSPATAEHHQLTKQSSFQMVSFGSERKDDFVSGNVRKNAGLRLANKV